MKKLSLLLIGLLLIPSLLLTSCDKGDDPDVVLTPTFTVLKDYMINNNLDIDKILTSPAGAKFVQGAPAEADLATFLAKYYIIDIRGAADFAANHIQGAKNVPFANILAELVVDVVKRIFLIFILNSFFKKIKIPSLFLFKVGMVFMSFFIKIILCVF